MWKSYKQERGCLAHFLRLLAVWWPGAQSAQDNHALACNYAKYSPILMSFCVYTCFVMNEESIANEAVVHVCRINVNIDLFFWGFIDFGWLGSPVVSVLDSGAEGPRFKSQPRRCRVTVLGKLSTPICLCSPSSKIGSSPLTGCGGNCRSGGK